MQNYCIVDVETTGANRQGQKITEIAIIKTDGEKVIEEFSTLINPERRIPIRITYLTGITNEMVQDAPKFYEVAKRIIEMTEDCVFVAHNVFFDYQFIQREFNELGFQFRKKLFCTVKNARLAFPGLKSYSLKNLSAHFKIELKNHLPHTFNKAQLPQSLKMISTQTFLKTAEFITFTTKNMSYFI